MDTQEQPNELETYNLLLRAKMMAETDEDYEVLSKEYDNFMKDPHGPVEKSVILLAKRVVDNAS